MLTPQQDFHDAIDEARAIERADATQASRARFEQIERISAALERNAKPQS